LLRILAECEGEATLKYIAEQVGLPPSTTHRLLNILARQGLVERGPSKSTYRAGLEYLRLGSLVKAKMELQNVAQAFLTQLVGELDESCFLSIYLPTQQKIMVTNVTHGSNPLRYDIPQYAPMSVAWGATGRAVLAFLPDEAIDQILSAQEPSPATNAPMPNPAEIKAELEDIRAQGFALTSGQKLTGAVGLAAPIFGSDGNVLGALCLTFPKGRHSDSHMDRFTQTLTERAGQLSAAMGYRSKAPLGSPARRKPR
jgi:IclR family acetate operon transcriptional repressor